MNLLNNHQSLQNKSKTSNYHWLNRWLRLLRKQPCLRVTQAFISLENQSTTGPPAPVIRWCLQIFSNIRRGQIFMPSSCVHTQTSLHAPSSHPGSSISGGIFTFRLSSTCKSRACQIPSTDVASWLLYWVSRTKTNLFVKCDPLHASLAARRGKREGGVGRKIAHHGSVFTAHLTP